MGETVIVSRELLQQALEALEALDAPPSGVVDHYELDRRKQALRAALAQQTQTRCDIAEDGVCEVIDCCRNPTQEEQEPVAYTDDILLKMRAAGMTFHLGMPHTVVMEQMTRFHDLVCAEASIKTAVAFSNPPRREWQALTDEIIDSVWPSPEGTNSIRAVAYAIEAKLKEKNQ